MSDLRRIGRGRRAPRLRLGPVVVFAVAGGILGLLARGGDLRISREQRRAAPPARESPDRTPPVSDPQHARVEADRPRASHARDDRLATKEVRRLLLPVLRARMPDRRLSRRDYERLRHAVLRLRRALAAVETADKMAPGRRDEARRTMLTALAEIETVTGVARSELGLLLAAAEGADTAPGSRP